jgi:hypothetical protein
LFVEQNSSEHATQWNEQTEGKDAPRRMSGQLWEHFTAVTGFIAPIRHFAAELQAATSVMAHALFLLA